MPIPELITDNLIITVLKPDEFRLLSTYEINNRHHLSEWEPLRRNEYFTDEEVKKRVELNYENFKSGLSVSFVALDKIRSKIVCVCCFSNIVHGAFKACNLGYSVNASDQGKGLMYEML